MSDPRVTVVGGGIVGSSCAYHLARAGVETRLIDRDDAGRATDAGAGIVSPPTSSKNASEEWFDVAIAAHEYYPELVERLEREQDDPTGYEETGLLAVAVSDDEVDAYENLFARIERRQRERSRPEPGSVEEIGEAAARERVPALESVRRAFYYENAARVIGSRLEAALREAGRSHGLTVREGDVTTLEVENGAIARVETADGRTFETERVVVAGGAWSDSFAEQLGVRIPVEPKRGQIAHLERPEGGASEWPIVVGFRDHYLVPWDDARVVAGATREVGSGFDVRRTAAGVREVLDEALRVAPGLADATFREVRVGLRPASPDGLPILGPVPGLDGAHLATGHGATGLQLGPYSGKLVADSIVDGAAPDALSRFSVSRFAE